MATISRSRTAERLALALFAGATYAAAGAQAPTRVRTVRADTLRDSTSVRVVVNTDPIERMIHELMASKALEETIVSALREAGTGQRADTGQLRKLRSQLEQIARRNAGMITTIQMQCANQGPLPEGYLGVEFEQTSSSKADDEPMVWQFGPVLSVTPGSPAERAGIQRGDVVLSINGVDARKPGALAGALKVGARVPVRLQRGRLARDVTVLVEKRPQDFGSECTLVDQMISQEGEAPVVFLRRQLPSGGVAAAGPVERGPVPPAPPATPRAPMGVPQIPGSFFTMTTGGAAMAIAGMQVIPLDDDWRLNLGVDNGVLLTHVAQGTPAKDAALRSGDVIIAADDEKISSPRALQRIIGNSKSHAVKLQIVRAGKTQVITLRWQ
jgi:hypothetical protein